MNTRTTVILLTLSLIPGLALAQGAGNDNGNNDNGVPFGAFNPKLIGVHRGTRELTFSGDGTADSSFKNSDLGLSIGYGWYSSESLEFSIRQALNFAGVDGHNIWKGSTEAAMDYHWTGGRWRPFAGALVGFVFGDGVNDTGIIGPEIGIKYYIRPNAFFYGREEYQVLFDSGGDNNNFKNGSFVHALGIGLNF